MGRGAVPEMSLADNALLTGTAQELTHRGIICTEAMRDYASAIAQVQRPQATGADAVARSLSGGNLQKFIVGREILQRSAGDDRRAADVGRRRRRLAQIRQALIDLRDEGVAVLVVSEELDELLEICDRLAVIARWPAVAGAAHARRRRRGQSDR